MKRNLLIIIATLFVSAVQINAYADYCLIKKIGGFCSFDSLSSTSSPHTYFHCDADKSYYIKIYTHNVLVGGFAAGSGTLTLTGSDIKKVLNKYYFEVAHHDGHNGFKYIAITSLGSIHCHIGKGERSAVFPGPFALQSEKM